MKVLVTGATGFIGQQAVHALAASGHSIRLAVRTPHTGLPFESVVVGDLGPETDWTLALRGMDGVVHLAARVHVMRDRADGDVEHQRVNTDGTLRLARAAADAGARRFVFISTIKVSGEATTDRPFLADDEPHPVDAYSRSKLAAEIGLRSMPDIDAVIIRPPLVHGPGAKGNLARFCRLARSGVPVPLAGISNRRDLVGVDNLVNLIERCLVHPAAPGQVFLASDGEALATPELYRMIAAALDRPARLVYVPIALMRWLARPLGLAGEVARLTQSLEIDIGKTRELLSWQPPRTAAEGIAAMARAYAAAIP